ncbi:hypothetical protein T06_12012 [Trichinella sp. T6]|nr:hypothetical protein T06_12012 [Trichinella sp. T6]
MDCPKFSDHLRRNDRMGHSYRVVKQEAVCSNRRQSFLNTPFGIAMPSTNSLFAQIAFSDSILFIIDLSVLMYQLIN